MNEKELFIKQQKELFITEMKLFKSKLLTSIKHNATSCSHQPSNNIERIIFLQQDQTEFLQEELKSKEKIEDVFFLLFLQKTATLNILENPN